MTILIWIYHNISLWNFDFNGICYFIVMYVCEQIQSWYSRAMYSPIRPEVKWQMCVCVCVCVCGFMKRLLCNCIHTVEYYAPQEWTVLYVRSWNVRNMITGIQDSLRLPVSIIGHRHIRNRYRLALNTSMVTWELCHVRIMSIRINGYVVNDVNTPEMRTAAYAAMTNQRFDVGDHLTSLDQPVVL